MASFTTCLAEARKFLSPEAVAKIVKQAAALRDEGVPHADAAKRAVQDHLMESQDAVNVVETAFKDGTTLYEAEPPKTEAGKAEAEAAVSRVDQVVRDMPDLMVQMDGMDAPMKAADFLAMVRAEADELAADGPLMQIAAECFLLHP